MRLLRRLLGLVLGLTMAVTVWSFVTTRTVFDAAYALRVADRTQLYPALAAATPALLDRLTPLTSAEQHTLAPYIDPGQIKAWSEQLLPELERFYRQGGVRPHLDISGLVGDMQGAGLTVPPPVVSVLSRPVAVDAGRADPLLSEIIRWSDHLRIWGIVLAVGLAGLGLALTRRHFSRWLAGVLVTAAVMTLGGWMVLKLTPSLITSALTSSVGQPLDGPVMAWLKVLVAAPAQQLVKASAVMVLAVPVVIALGVVGQLLHRHHRPAHRE